MEKSNSRNNAIDAVRGLAIILVIIGHVIEVNVTGFYESTVFNIIWSLQMPLFMLISGYVTRYSAHINNKKGYFNYLLKRSLTYLLPWVIWTIFVKGLLLGSTNFWAYIKYITFSMDAGYWFLFSLWTISMIFGTATYIANKFTNKNNLRIVITILVSIIFSVFLLIIGLKVGINFLGIKLTLYYLPFFYLGYLYANIENVYSERAWFKAARQAVILPSIVVYAIIILNINLYSMEDNISNILIRMTASVLGCTIVFYTVSVSRFLASQNERVGKALLLAGQYSLELYVVHELLISIMDVIPKPEFLSVDGFILCTVNFILMLLFLIIIIYCISANKWSRLILFGKK
ncbi:MAG: hypothetical protein A2Y15_02265 [Clostridiales bacterium GWF2_36_10]|nr:MAG: hypothetical protein A2Y15_02265 [Clostridiales bacterium GWF2_36_10]HAN21280.1 hypothetical protein [Clostridiales bacterium]